MSYRPICDLWILARAKLKPHKNGDKRSYFGSFPGGFPERARVLLGCSIDEPVLHVCGGAARFYPYAKGFGKNDKTLDLDPETEPDYLQDARSEYPRGFRAILADPPYSTEDAKHYRPGEYNYPKPNEIVKRSLEALEIGGRVGIIHYQLPGMPKNAKFLACVGVVVGFQNRIRVFSVFEKIA